MIKVSCWEDAIYTVNGEASLYYNIYDDEDTLLYTGKAFQRPNSNIKINVSQIVRNYLNSTLPPTAFSGTAFQEGQFYLPYATLGFTLTDGKGNVFETYKFLNCWDYVTRYSLIDNSTMNFAINKYINNHFAVGQYKFASVLTKTNKVRVTISVEDNGTACGYGALYYSNALGGWDSFLIEGRITKKEAFTKYNIDNNFIADTLQFGHRTINNTISESWELQTQYLTDDESKTLCDNLYGSNNVYFHDFATSTIVPVTITDTSITYKTYKNQGKKYFMHTINVKNAQDHQRI